MNRQLRSGRSIIQCGQWLYRTHQNGRRLPVIQRFLRVYKGDYRKVLEEKARSGKRTFDIANFPDRARTYYKGGVRI